MAQRAKGDLLPLAGRGDASPSRQSATKGGPATLLPTQPSTSTFPLAAVAFVLGAVTALVLGLASGAVQWQEAAHAGVLGNLVRTGRSEAFGVTLLQMAPGGDPAAWREQQPLGTDAAASAAVPEQYTGGAGGTAGKQLGAGWDGDSPQPEGAAAVQTAAAAGLQTEPAPCPQAPLLPACPEPRDCAMCPKAPALAAVPLPAPPAPVQPKRLRMPWQPILSQREVRRGLSYYGSGERLRAVVAKLQAGQPIKAYTLGGSVTKGQGASTAAAGYAARFFGFINATWPHRDHVLVNKGIGGTSSGVYSACAEQMVGSDPDLIIVEFTVNERPDAEFATDHRRGYEQLLRKLLRMPGPPAVIQMHHYAWWRAVGDSVKFGLYYAPRAEEQLTVMSHFYDIPSISLRAAVYELLQSGVDGFKTDKVWDAGKVTTVGIKLVQAPKGDRHLYFYNDRTHPNDRGHQVVAELLAGLVLKAAAEEAEGWEEAVAQAAGWAPDLRLQQPGTAGPQLPPPMIPGNADVPTSLCAIQEGFKPMVVAAKGFEYTAERPDEETFVGQKWAWTGTEPGAWAELEFDSRNLPPAGQPLTPEQRDRRAEVYLTHLRGYEGFGAAAISCVSGCKCGDKGRVLDGTWRQKATLMQVHRFQVSQHRKCRVRVTVLKEAGRVPQDGHKVSLTAIMVSHFLIRLKTKPEQAEEVANLV